jgi:outer membrane receptor protein involved in Fe transport
VAPFLFYDYSTGFTVTGNDTLKASRIYNYDLRYEIYPGRGQVFSITGFYKKFKSPIEAVYQLNAVNPNITFQNSPDAAVSGFETEIRIVPGALLNTAAKFLNNLTLLANYAYINSKVVIPFSADIKIDRRLQGQAPYVFNTGLIYNDVKNEFGFSAFVNRTGARIFYGGNNYFADVWENGRTVVDCQISKSFYKQKVEVALNFKDLLAQKQYFFEDKNNNKKYDAVIDNDVQITTYGKLITLNIVMKF